MHISLYIYLSHFNCMGAVSSPDYFTSHMRSTDHHVVLVQPGDDRRVKKIVQELKWSRSNPSVIACYIGQKRKQTGTLHQKRVSRAVAAGLLSPVSTRPLFPSFVAYLALPISAIAWRTPTQRPGAHRCHVETCEMAANSATELFHESSLQQLSVLVTERRVSQASPAKDVVSADKRTGSKTQHQWCTTQWAKWHSYETLSSSLRESSYWPKNGLRSYLIAPKFC